MADEYVFEINVIFTIEVEHVFSKDELEEAEGIESALELFGDELRDELEAELFDIKIYEFPKKGKKNNKYLYSFMNSSCLSFDEDDVSVLDEDLIDGALAEYEKEWKKRLELIEYPVKGIDIHEGMLMEVIEGNTISPQDMAKRLIKKHEYMKDYCISKKEFKRIAGKKYLRDSYINEVDFKLRKKGYLLIDLINEQSTIAIASIDTIIKWEQVDENISD